MSIPHKMSSNQAHTEPLRRKRSLVGARLRKHADYQRAYAASRKRQSASMSWFLAPQTETGPQLIAESAAGYLPSPRVGLTAGKMLGNAHERNRIKRRMRDILRRHVELLPAGFDLVLHPRRSVLTAEFAKLEAELVRILGQANAEAARLAELVQSVQPANPPKPTA